MDASVTTQNSKKRKLPEGQKNKGTEDRISCLPDSILLCILSLLPTKFAVLTSALSRRWMYLWTSVPNLDFSEDKPADSKVFMNFVDRVLLLNDLSNIHRFRLLCSDRLDASRINAWIFTAIKRKVQELILEIGVKDPCIFPRSLFTCDTLVKLQIHKTDLKLPPSIHLSCLKVLHLNLIKLLCNQSSQQVSFTLPMIKEFVMENCETVEIKTISIFSPALETFILNNNQIWCGHCEIKVYAKSLRYFYLKRDLDDKISIYNLSSLATASIAVYDYFGWKTASVSNLLRAVSNVQDLTLSESSVAVLVRADVFADWLTFSSLVHLKVVYNLYILRNNPRVGQLIDLLCHLPNVEHFCLSNSSHSSLLLKEEHGWTVEAIPKPTLLHLKTVTVKHFHGSGNELYLVGVLLKIAKALKTMTIISSRKLLENPKSETEVAKRLLSLPRHSTCVVNFS